MARAEAVDHIPQGTRCDAFGATWDQIASRRLTSGEYVRVLLEQQGSRLLIQFGNVKADDPNVIEWRWELPLVAVDAAALIGMVSFGQAHAAGNADLLLQQVRANKDDLEGKVLSLARQLKEMKDAAAPR